MSTNTEKRNRRTSEEILVLIDKAEKLISNGMPKTKAAEEVGITYQTLMNHLGEGYKTSKSGDKVDFAVKNLVEAVRAQVKKEILGKL